MNFNTVVLFFINIIYIFAKHLLVYKNSDFPCTKNLYINTTHVYYIEQINIFVNIF